VVQGVSPGHVPQLAYGMAQHLEAGLLAIRGDESATQLYESAACLITSSYHLAGCLLDHAQHLISRGDEVSAQLQLNEAASIADRLRAAPLIERAANMASAVNLSSQLTVNTG
jgi:hypothetical protein